MARDFDPRSGRFWAYVGTIMGVTVSAAANYTETHGNKEIPDNAQTLAAIGMSLLPVGLFIALEVLVRNRIKENLNWWRAGMFVTALAFAVPSYSHMHDLLVSWDQNDAISYVTPIGWDGLMLLSTLALLLDPAKATTDAAGQGGSTAAPSLTPRWLRRRGGDPVEPQAELEPEDYAALAPVGPLTPPAGRVLALSDYTDRSVANPYEYDTDEIAAITEATAPPKRAAQSTQSARSASAPRSPTAPAPRTASARGGSRRGARDNPEQHPLFADWLTARRSGTPWSAQYFAGLTNLSLVASRNRLERWNEHQDGIDATSERKANA